MALPEFNHIHTSSRFDRTPASLEADLDRWMEQCSIITLTEVSDNRRAATLREKGWAHFNAKKGQGADNCAVCWDTSVWSRTWGGVKKLHLHRYMRPQAHKPAGFVHACSVILKHKASGNTILITVAHLPNAIQQGQGFVHSGYDWRARKAAYVESVKNWSTLCQGIVRSKKNLDAVLVVADWNISLKDNWFRDFLRNHWGRSYKLTWKHFPTAGSLSAHGRIIDGSLVKNLKIVEGADLMPRAQSSDHRPYRERLGFMKGTAGGTDDDDADGDTRPGRAWWGFGDYDGDEEYKLSIESGEAGGEVL